MPNAILFDHQARRSVLSSTQFLQLNPPSLYLTSFHKRKLARAEAARNRAQQRQRQQRLHDRQQVPVLLILHLPLIPLQRRRALRERAAENARQVQHFYGTFSSSTCFTTLTLHRTSRSRRRRRMVGNCITHARIRRRSRPCHRHRRPGFRPRYPPPWPTCSISTCQAACTHIRKNKNKPCKGHRQKKNHAISFLMILHVPRVMSTLHNHKWNLDVANSHVRRIQIDFGIQ